MRVSASRSAVAISPTVTFKSAESLSDEDATPALLSRKSEDDGRDGEGKETKGLVRTTALAASRSAISLTPRITFKSFAVAEGNPFESSPLVPEKTPERDSGRSRRPQSRVIRGASKGEIRKAGGGQGLPSGSSSPVLIEGSPRVSRAAMGPMAAAPTAVTTSVVASTGVSCGDNGAVADKGAPDTVATAAQTAANGRPGANRGIYRRSDTRRESAAGSLVGRDPPTKSTESTPQEAKTSDTPSITLSPLDISASLTAVEGIARDDGAEIGFLPTEATAPKSAGKESPAATSRLEAAQSYESRGESPEVKSSGACSGSDQDMVGSSAKAADGKVGTPGIVDEGGKPSTLQDTTVRARKMRFSVSYDVVGVALKRPRAAGFLDPNDQENRLKYSRSLSYVRFLVSERSTAFASLIVSEG